MKIFWTNLRVLVMNSKLVPILSMVAFLPLIFILNNVNEIRGALFINVHALKMTQGEIDASVVNFLPGKSSGYVYHITYNYEVAGVSYESDQVNFSCIKGEKNPRYAERYVSKYPIGKRVNVYYKSDEPTFSVLEPYVTYPTIKYFLIYVTLSFITTIICIVLHLSQKRFKAENE